jgi:hypothetical protein
MTEIFTANGQSNLKLLHVHNNMLGEGGAKNISPLVSNAPNLEDFRFSTTRVPEAGAAVLGAALGHATKLKRLNLSDNTYGIGGATALAGSLAKMPDMEWLNLCDTGEHNSNQPRSPAVCNRATNPTGVACRLYRIDRGRRRARDEGHARNGLPYIAQLGRQ